MNLNKEFTDTRLDGIYNFIDNNLIYNKDYKLIDAILKNIDFEKWTEDELLGFLVITFPFKNRFDYREEFYNKLWNAFNTIYTEEITNRILQGLK